MAIKFLALVIWFYLIASIVAQTATISIGDLHQYIPPAVRDHNVFNSTYLSKFSRPLKLFLMAPQSDIREMIVKVSMYPSLPAYKPTSKTLSIPTVRPSTKAAFNQYEMC